MEDLDDILVISVEQAVAAPYVSGRLAEAGARVIKVERTDGDFARRYDDFVQGESAYFVWLNGGKESVRLNLKRESDQQLLENMLSKADVFIQNLAPGAISRIGFDPARLRKDYPRLIVCSISGYGENGPYRNQKAYDLLIQAESGLCSINGSETELARVGVSVSDISAGMTAFQSVLQALYARHRTGEGRIINVSLFHSTADWMNVPYLQHRYGNFTPGRHGLKHPSIAPYGAFECSDGKLILISIQSSREWESLCNNVLNAPQLIEDPRFRTNTLRVENRPELDTLVGREFAQATRKDIAESLDAAKIAYGRLSDLKDLCSHPQNRYRGVETAGGPVELLGRGALITGQEQLESLSVPKLGEHDILIREEFAS
ncbi:MAG: CaiB/BaiF CoA-transferase family protein [Pseudomonadota bacterium]